MGKYNNSEIHNRYSDWHWSMVNKDDRYKRLYVSDVDRLWFEYDFNKNEVVAVIDIKWLGVELGMTSTEKGIYEWLEKAGAKIYIVFINKDFTKFQVHNMKGQSKQFTETEYADWLLRLRC